MLHWIFVNNDENQEEKEFHIWFIWKSAKQKSPSFICVLHNTKVPKTDTFLCFSSVKCDPAEKLSKLLQIRESRLAESTNSPHHIKNVCDMLPENLDGLDLDTTGYHKRCYQKFTTHLDRLQIASANASTSKKHHSLCKRYLQVQHLNAMKEELLTL